MFDTHQHPAEDTSPAEALPYSAVRTLRACSRDDHARARTLRHRSTDENGRSHKLRCARLRSRSEACEDRSRELAQEAGR